MAEPAYSVVVRHIPIMGDVQGKGSSPLGIVYILLFQIYTYIIPNIYMIRLDSIISYHLVS